MSERRRTGVPAALGFAGSALMVWGTANPMFVFNTAGWPNPIVAALGRSLPDAASIAVIIAGMLLLLGTWLWINPCRAVVDRPLLMLAIWTIPFWFAPPILSSDAVLYADAGHIIYSGLNPYLVGLGGAGGPWAQFVDPLWLGTGVAYPPLTLLIDAALVALAPTTYAGIVLMRVPALAGLALMAVSLNGIARSRHLDPAKALWWGVLNPLVVIHFAGGAHNDALMAGVSLLTIWLVLLHPTRLMQFLWAPALVGVAMALKQQGGLTVLAVAALPILEQVRAASRWERVWLLARRTAAVTAVAVVVFVLISLVSPLGFGWIKWLSLMGAAGTIAPFGMISQYGGLAIAASGGDPTGFRAAVAAVGTVVTLATVVWVLVRFSGRPLKAMGWASLAVAVLGQALHPWYVPWSLALLGTGRLSHWQRRLLAAFVIGFVLWNTVQSTVFYKVRL